MSGSTDCTSPIDCAPLTALLEDNVRDAARTVCMNADPSANPYSDATADCVHEAIDNAQPQVDALIARAQREAK